MTNPIDLILPRLDKVKPSGPGKWKARCPAHDDKDPSLSIREADDGKVLLHCWAGCEARDITAAIGLELRDLFPGDKQPRRGPSKAAQQFEAYVLSVGLALIRKGTPMSAADLERFETAKRRLGVA
ncbi:hypothetical protein D3C85_1438870 [compost metagenome]